MIIPYTDYKRTARHKICKMSDAVISSKSDWDQLGVKTCDKCNLKTSDIGFFQAHVCRTTKASSISYNVVKGLFSCSTCRVELTEAPFEEHLEQHLTRKPYSCYYCNELFKTREDVYVHVKNHIANGAVSQIGFETCILRVSKKTKAYMIKAKNRGNCVYTSKNAVYVPTPFGATTQNMEKTNSCKSPSYRRIAPKPSQIKSQVADLKDNSGDIVTPEPSTPQKVNRPRCMPFYPHIVTNFHMEGNLSFQMEPSITFSNGTRSPLENNSAVGLQTCISHVTQPLPPVHVSKVKPEEKAEKVTENYCETSSKNLPRGIFQPFTHSSNLFVLLKGHFICLTCKQKWRETADFIKHIWLFHLKVNNSLPNTNAKFSIQNEELQSILKTLHDQTCDESLRKNLSPFILHHEKFSHLSSSINDNLQAIVFEQSLIKSTSPLSRDSSFGTNSSTNVITTSEKCVNLSSNTLPISDHEKELEGSITALCTEENTLDKFKQLVSSFYQCGFPDCVFSSHLPVDLLIHNYNTHPMESDIPCVYCGQVNKTARGLLEHLDSHVGQNGIKAMHTCSLVQSSKATCIVENRNTKKIFNNLRKAADRKRDSARDSEIFLQYRCNLCCSDFQTLQDLQVHLNKSLLKVVACKHCRGHFLDIPSWRKHMSRDHPRDVKLYRINEKLLCRDRKANCTTYEKLVTQRRSFRSSLHKQNNYLLSFPQKDGDSMTSEEQTSVKENAVNVLGLHCGETRSSEPLKKASMHLNDLNAFSAGKNSCAQKDSQTNQELDCMGKENSRLSMNENYTEKQLDTGIEENGNAHVDAPNTHEHSSTCSEKGNTSAEMNASITLKQPGIVYGRENTNVQASTSNTQDQSDTCTRRENITTQMNASSTEEQSSCTGGKNANEQMNTSDIKDILDICSAGDNEKDTLTKNLDVCMTEKIVNRPVTTPEIKEDDSRFSSELSVPVYFKCSECPFETFSSYFLAKKHKNVHLDKKAAIRRFSSNCFDKSKTYKCTYCSYLCAGDKALMLKHLRSCHKYYVCGYCGDEYAVLRFMENHLKYRHIGKDKKIEERHPHVRSAFRLNNHFPNTNENKSDFSSGAWSRKRIHEAGETDQPSSKRLVFYGASTPNTIVSEIKPSIDDSTRSGVLMQAKGQNRNPTSHGLSGRALSLVSSQSDSGDHSPRQKEQPLKLENPDMCDTIHFHKVIKETLIRSAGSPCFQKPQEISYSPKLLLTCIEVTNESFRDGNNPSAFPSSTSCVPSSSKKRATNKPLSFKTEMSISDYPYQCYICKINMKSIQYVLDHIRWLHPNDQNNALVFDRKSQVVFSKEGVVKDTLTDLELPQQKHMCTACNFKANLRTEVISHVKLVHASINSEESVLSLNLPNQETVAPRTEHSDGPESTAPSKVSQELIVDTGPASEDSFQAKQTPSRGLRYSCHLCSEVLFSEFYFKLHLAIHDCFTCTSVLSSMDGLLLCPVCGYVAKSNSDLAEHTNGHLTERRYACSHCDADDHKRKGLLNHIRKYHGACQDVYVIDRETRCSEEVKPRVVDTDPRLVVEDVFKIPSRYLNKRLRQAGVKGVHVPVDIYEDIHK